MQESEIRPIRLQGSWALGGLHFIPDSLERNNMLAGLLLGGFFDLRRQFEARQDCIDTVKSDR